MANMITPNFSRSEMACRCGCGHDEMDQEFMRMLQALRDEIGPMPVTSGFRCDAHNNDVSTVKNGRHTLAKAADILISGERAMQLFEKARQIGFSGIGLNQKGQLTSGSYISIPWIVAPCGLINRFFRL